VEEAEGGQAPSATTTTTTAKTTTQSLLGKVQEIAKAAKETFVGTGHGAKEKAQVREREREGGKGGRE